jgi:hypothetical protein
MENIAFNLGMTIVFIGAGGFFAYLTRLAFRKVRATASNLPTKSGFE